MHYKNTKKTITAITLAGFIIVGIFLINNPVNAETKCGTNNSGTCLPCTTGNPNVPNNCSAHCSSQSTCGSGQMCCTSDLCQDKMGTAFQCMASSEGSDCQRNLCTDEDSRQCCKPKSSSASTVVATAVNSGSLTNPLGTVNSIPGFIGIIIRGLLGIVGSLSLVMFIYGGFLWMTSGGNEDSVKKGKQTILWAVMGITLIFTSYAILSFVLNILSGNY